MKKVKSFSEISMQCERIFMLHMMGFGTERMFSMCEVLFFRVLALNGY